MEFAGYLYDCIHQNYSYRQAFETSAAFGAGAEGATQDGAEELVEFLLSSKEFFQLSYQEALAQNLMTLELLKLELQACQTTTTDQTGTDKEIDTLAGQLFDCLQDNHEYRQVFEQAAAFGAMAEGATQGEAEAVVHLMLSSREFLRLSYQEAISQGSTTEDILDLEVRGCEASTMAQMPLELESNVLARQFYDCLDTNEAFKEYYKQNLLAFFVSQGATPLESSAATEFMFSSSDAFLMTLQEISDYSTMRDFLKAETAKCEAEFLANTRSPIDTGTIASRLFDCQQENEQFRQLLLDSIEGLSTSEEMSNEDFATLLAVMFVSKDVFVEVMFMLEDDHSVADALPRLLEACERGP